MVKRFRRSIAVAFGMAGALGAQTAAPVPNPSGPFQVGTQRFVWTDSSRTEIAGVLRRDTAGVVHPSPPSGPRRIVVQLWYPAQPASASAARAPYNPSAAAFTGVIRDTMRLQQYRTTSGRATLAGTPVTNERFPLILFSPGGSMFIEDYTFALEELASHGYVVAAIGHPGTSLVSFGDGGFGIENAWRPPTTLSRSLALDSLRVSWAFYRERDAYLARDVSFARRCVSDPAWSPVVAAVDTNRLGFIGHSTGGSVAVAASALAAGARAVVVYDVILPAMLFGDSTSVPFALFRTTATNYPPDWTERLLGVFAGVRGDGFDVLLNDASHQGFSDRLLFAAGDSVGRAKALQQFNAASTFTRSFLDHYVKGQAGLVFGDLATQQRLGGRVTKHPSVSPHP